MFQMKIQHHNVEYSERIESKSKRLRDKHSRAEENVDTKLKERDFLLKMKADMKRNKIENVVDTANEILERKKSIALESF